MLDKGLAQTAAQITGDIRQDFQMLGQRMETIENKLDMTVSRTIQNSDHIQVLQHQLDIALSKIDDLENRSRRENFHIRGIPESVKDTVTVVQDLLKQLIPNIPPHKLEID